MFSDMAGQAATLFAPVLMAVMGYGVSKLNTFIAVKIKNENLKGCLQRIDDAVITGVKSVGQAYVDSLKQAGKFDDVAKANAKTAAVNAAKAYLGDKGLQAASDVLGLGMAALTDVLSHKVEAAVADNKSPSTPTANPAVVS